MDNFVHVQFKVLFGLLFLNRPVAFGVSRIAVRTSVTY